MRGFIHDLFTFHGTGLDTEKMLKSKLCLLVAEAVVPHLSVKGSNLLSHHVLLYTQRECVFPTSASEEIPPGSTHPFNSAFQCSGKFRAAVAVVHGPLVVPGVWKVGNHCFRGCASYLFHVRGQQYQQDPVPVSYSCHIFTQLYPLEPSPPRTSPYDTSFLLYLVGSLPYIT